MSKFRLDKIGSNFQNVKRSLPPIIGNMAQNFFRSSFEKQGFTDVGLRPWPERKKHDAGRAILVKSGKLRNAVNRSLRTTEWTNISFEVNLPYAAAHNYGYRGTQYIKPHGRKSNRISRKGLMLKAQVSAHTRKMVLPERKFIGNSRVLVVMMDQKVRQNLSRLLK